MIESTSANNELNDEAPSDLSQQWGIISYLELQKFFAKGVIVIIDQKLSLTEAARAVNRDDSEQIKVWTEQRKVTRATDKHAKQWLKEQAVFKAIATAPWVLVQEVLVQEPEHKNTTTTTQENQK